MANKRAGCVREREQGEGLRRVGDFGEEQRERILVDILGEVVEGFFKTFGGVYLLFFQGVKDSHQGATRMGASIRGRAEKNLSEFFAPDSEVSASNIDSLLGGHRFVVVS